MKTFLISTAVAAAMATAAYAEGHSGINFMAEAEGEALLASDLLGARIYATEGAFDAANYEPGMETDWDDIGEINELIVARDGAIDGVVLGVGGFLGLGEKNVGIPMDQLTFVSDGEDADEYFIVVNASQQMLEEAPDFRTMQERQAAAQMEERDPMIDTEAAAIEGSMMQEAEAQTEEAANAVDQMGDEIEGETQEIAASAEAMGDELEAETQEVAADVTMEREADTRVEVAEGSDAETMQDMGAANAPLLAAPEMERDGYSRIEMADLTVERLNGATVYDVNDENVGEIGTFVLDGERLDQAVIDFGGFLGLGEKQVALPMDALNVQQSADGSSIRVYVDVTEARLDQMPEYEG
ncbi:PRC-barrel domain-containing protein [Pontivivens insulae]|nr:PRC-barrel domain-containing protein [Pontivivens insulae]